MGIKLAFFMISIWLGACQITQLTSASSFESFTNFEKKYNKKYEKQAERIYRRTIFTKNQKKINDHNAKSLRSYQMAINKFADLSEDQFTAQYATLFDWNPEAEERIQTQSKLNQLEESICTCDEEKTNLISELKNKLKANKALEKAVKKAKQKKSKASTEILADLVTEEQLIAVDPAQQLNTKIKGKPRLLQQQHQQNYVDWSLNCGPVIHQGSCGSCYAAATVQSVQALYSIAIFGGAHFQFSIQQIVDCQNQEYDGCLGGWLQSSYQFIKDKGVTSHFKYPYTSENSGTSSQSCKYSTGQFKINSYKTIQDSCSQIRKILDTRPLAAAISGLELQFYSSGIFDGCKESSIVLNHAIIIVGYGKQGWKIKNSWGSFWGEYGYARITSDEAKNCGICKLASAPFLEGY